jgi:hypothetical protein
VLAGVCIFGAVIGSVIGGVIGGVGTGTGAGDGDNDSNNECDSDSVFGQSTCVLLPFCVICHLMLRMINTSLFLKLVLNISYR